MHLIIVSGAPALRSSRQVITWNIKNIEPKEDYTCRKICVSGSRRNAGWKSFKTAAFYKYL